MSGRPHILAPVLFVFIYGSGFVGAKFGLPYSEPFTFLAMRFSIAGAFLAAIALFLRARWKFDNLNWLLISGFLLQSVFASGVFYAIYHGIKPAVVALIITLQPMLVAALGGTYLGEKVTRQNWVGLTIGIAGVSIVVADGLSTDGISLLGLSWAIAALIGFTFGQLVQKKHCASMDLFVGGFIQTISAAITMAAFALLFETGKVIWSGEYYIALAWTAVGVSIGAWSLMYYMLKHSSSNQVASIFYAVPVGAALVAWPLFGQVPNTTDWIGFGIVALSVLISNNRIKFLGRPIRSDTP